MCCILQTEVFQTLEAILGVATYVKNSWESLIKRHVYDIEGETLKKV